MSLRSSNATALALALASWLGLAGPLAPSMSAQVLLTPDEVKLAREFSPLPDPPDDPTNAVYADAAAARLGQALFFDTRLSANGEISCAFCHDPDRGWGDARRLAKGIRNRPRHTPTLWNVAYNRWFYWDGRKDTLWSQALAPIEDPNEQGMTRLEVVHLIARDDDYAQAYADVFGSRLDVSDAARFPAVGRPMEQEPKHPNQLAWDSMAPDDQRAVNRAFSNVGKAIAAYERQILSRRAPFDVFVEGLDDGDPDKLAAIPQAAQRGFSLFVGKARCQVCHDGPNFTDLEFHSNRVATEEGVDPGRALGILRLTADPFNSASPFADDGGAVGAHKLHLARRGWHIPGEFKTPTLRNVAVTAPYMHEGQMRTLQEVVHFYSTLEGAAPPDPKGEKLIAAVDLTESEQSDLIAFLESLTDVQLLEALRTRPDSPRLDTSGS